MKAFRLNEFEVYAADTLEQAIECAMNDSGCGRDDVLDDMFGYEENDNSAVWIDEEQTQQTTIGAIVSEMTKAGFVCGYDA